MKNLLFIPCYNCSKQIVRVLTKLSLINLEENFYEILIIDNKSTDNTNNTILEFLSKNNFKIGVSLITNKCNYGLGGSHKIAFQYAFENKFDNVVVLHGDDQADITDVLGILKDKDFDQYDCYLGSRFMRGSKLKGYSKFRILGNKVFNGLFSLVLFKKILDLGSGLNIYSKRMLDNRFYVNFPNNLTFNYMMILATKVYNHKFKFFPISWNERDQISNVRLFQQTKQITFMLVNFLFFGKKSFPNTTKIAEYKFDIIKL